MGKMYYINGSQLGYNAPIYYGNPYAMQLQPHYYNMPQSIKQAAFYGGSPCSQKFSNPYASVAFNSYPLDGLGRSGGYGGSACSPCGPKLHNDINEILNQYYGTGQLTPCQQKAALYSQDAAYYGGMTQLGQFMAYQPQGIVKLQDAAYYGGQYGMSPVFVAPILSPSNVDSSAQAVASNIADQQSPAPVSVDSSAQAVASNIADQPSPAPVSVDYIVQAMDLILLASQALLQ